MILATCSCLLSLYIWELSPHYIFLQGHLFLLVTDQGYLRQSRIVWETLSNVEGDGDLVDSEFRIPQSLEPVSVSPVAVNTQEQVDQE